MPDKPNNPLSFWQELKRRKVLRVITVYAAVAFVILQLVEILAPSLRLPDWTMNFILVVLIVGFIIAIILSWIYDIHPEEGIVKTEPAHKVKDEDQHPSSKGWRIASYISFVVIVGLIVLNIIPRNKRSEVKEILDKSIAVLPLEYLSANPENEYLANGVLDAITGHLSLIKGLRVMPRTSIEQYRENKKTAKEIGEELDVSYLVEGSFQMVDNQVKLIIQLVLAKEGDHIFFKEYDRNYSDIFAVQSEVAQTIAKEIEVAITPEEQQRIEKIPTTNLTAYDFYQRGRDEHERFWSDSEDREALERAEDLYYKALEYDSTFALAYTGLALVYWNKHYWEEFLQEDFMDSVLILANKALSFDNQLSEAYALRGSYYQEHNKKEQALIEYDKAIKYNPNEWMAYWGKGGLYFYEDDYKNAIENFYKAASLYRGPWLPNIYKTLAILFSGTGFIETCEKYLKEALLLDDDSASYYNNLAQSKHVNSNFEKAIEYLKRSIAIDSTNWNNYVWIGFNYIVLGQFEESLAYYQKARNVQLNSDMLEPLDFNNMLSLGGLYYDIGKEEEGAYYLNRAREYMNEVDDLDRKPYYSEIDYIFNRAWLYLQLGDKDKTFEYLRLYYQKQHIPVWIPMQLKVNPDFNSIRDEPEFQQILHDVEAKYQAEHEQVRQWLEENDIL